MIGTDGCQDKMLIKAAKHSKGFKSFALAQIQNGFEISAAAERQLMLHLVQYCWIIVEQRFDAQNGHSK